MDLIFLKSLRPLYCDYISRILCVRRAQQRRPPRPPFMYFYSRPYARGDVAPYLARAAASYFYSRPYARGDDESLWRKFKARLFLLAPLREGRPIFALTSTRTANFYARPYARGDQISRPFAAAPCAISTRAPTRGATCGKRKRTAEVFQFLLAPLHEGRQRKDCTEHKQSTNFYSRPYARGDSPASIVLASPLHNFYSRPYARGDMCLSRRQAAGVYFYSRPYARGDCWCAYKSGAPIPFLLAPLREGRQQFFTKPQVDLYDKLLKIHIFQINTFCILQYSFENFKDYFVGSARTSRKNVYGKGWR